MTVERVVQYIRADANKDYSHRCRRSNKRLKRQKMENT